MQTNYANEHDIAILGAALHTPYKHTDSLIAEQPVTVGRGVVRKPGTSNICRNTTANYATLTVSTDLIAANSTIVTVDENDTTATVYATSHAATMAAIVVKVLALATVANAWLDAVDDTIIHIVSKEPVIDASAVTTLGSTQPTWAEVKSLLASSFYGVSQLTQRLEGTAAPNSDNAALYATNSLVNVLRRGIIPVNFETAFDPEKDTLFVRHTITTTEVVGDFRNDADSGKAVSLASLPIRVITHLSATGLGFLDINLP